MGLGIVRVLFIFLVVAGVCCAVQNGDRVLTGNETSHGGGEVFKAMLFPWFCQFLGIGTLFIISRWLPELPYTAVLFLEGVIIGVCFQRLGLEHGSELGESIVYWINIDPELLLLAFLPGLLFGDSLHVNWHLFKGAFLQNIWLAFPGVLLGTYLTALVGMYVLPYNWSFSLAMTMGAILSATDPVAVTALLSEVGAPPRLRMIIQGESMLNDGAAIVFFTIFGKIYLYEQDPSLGQNVSVGEGFLLFFRMALGGAAIGIAFAFATIATLAVMNRKLEAQDTIMQISLTFTSAYLSYYVAEVLCHTSGVLAVVFCGVITSEFGLPLVHHRNTLEEVWGMVEHLLNSLLFVLGGVVWGNVISDTEHKFSGTDWGYLILLFVLVIVIRAVLIALSYPFIANVGLKTNVRECTFMVWGGLRGAVGIALALSLDNDVREQLDPATSQQARRNVSLVFAFVGGVACLTLVVNGTTSGYILDKLQLTATSKARLQVIQSLHHAIRLNIIEEYVRVVSRCRFKCTDLDVIKAHVSLLSDMSAADIAQAEDNLVKDGEVKLSGCAVEEKYADETVEVALENMKSSPSSPRGVCIRSPASSSDQTTPIHPGRRALLTRENSRKGVAKQALPQESCDKMKDIVLRQQGRTRFKRASSSMDLASYTDRLTGYREVFIALLRSAFWELIEDGAIEKDSFITYACLQSLDMAADNVSKNRPLHDWSRSKFLSNQLEMSIEVHLKTFCTTGHTKKEIIAAQTTRQRLLFALAFQQAHKIAERELIIQYRDEHGASCVEEETVLNESKMERAKAQEIIEAADHELLQQVVSHITCSKLLSKQGAQIMHLQEKGLLKEKEAGLMFKIVTSDISHVNLCHYGSHKPDEYKTHRQEHSSCCC